MIKKGSENRTSVDTFLKAFLKEKRAMDAVTLALAQRRWADVVGYAMRVHSYPSAYKGGRLVVVVSSSVWIQELVLQNLHIKKKLRECGIDVHDVYYTAGKPKPVENEEEGLHSEKEESSSLSSREQKELQRFKRKLAAVKSESVRKHFLAIRMKQMKRQPL